MALSAVKAGITRLREKGGANQESLYDLVNGYVTAARSIKIRPGSEIDHELPEPVHGLMFFKGKFVVFAQEPMDPGSADYLVEVLRYPEVLDVPPTLMEIVFAEPFLGYPYVVARWSTGVFVHYWMQTAEAWQANHVYLEGEVVIPTTPDGYAYRATRLGDPAELWAAGVPRVIGDVIEPTVPNGYRLNCIDTQGADPRSGTTEPEWVATEGGLTYEDADAAPPPAPPGSGGGGGGGGLPPTIPPRYPNPNNPGAPTYPQ